MRLALLSQLLWVGSRTVKGRRTPQTRTQKHNEPQNHLPQRDDASARWDALVKHDDEIRAVSENLRETVSVHV